MADDVAIQHNLSAEGAALAGAETHATVEHHAEPALLGIAPPVAVVSTSMIVLLAIAVWKGLPGMLTKGLDSRIAEIKAQLEEAKTLRAEAEALRKEYADKIAGAEKDAEAMLANAQHEADAILKKAEADSKAMVERRKRMAEDKIAAAEREAVEDVRNRAVNAATTASRKLIADKHDAEADRLMADKVIAGI